MKQKTYQFNYTLIKCSNVCLLFRLNHIQNGLLSSLPYFGKYFMAVCASAFADHLRRKDVLSTTQIRKIFTTFATMVPGLLMIVQCFYGKLDLVLIRKQLKPIKLLLFVLFQ